MSTILTCFSVCRGDPGYKHEFNGQRVGDAGTRTVPPSVSARTTRRPGSAKVAQHRLTLLARTKPRSCSQMKKPTEKREGQFHTAAAVGAPVKSRNQTTDPLTRFLKSRVG